MAIRILLADDEPIILKGLRKLIPWESLGMEIVGQAGDGAELTKLIRDLEPEIVISDISMPHRTGIEILRWMVEEKLASKVIFISAYQEFAYAKEALSLGAVDYLIKPIEKEQLANALDKAKVLIVEEGEAIRSKDKLKRLEARRRSEELQEELGRLAEGTLSARSDAYRSIEDSMRAPFYTAIAVAIERLNDGAGRWSEQERKLAEFAVDNILSELLVAAGVGQYFDKNEFKMLVVAHADALKPYETAQDIKSKINGYLKLDVSIGVGLAVRELGNLRESCRQAMQALETKYFEGLNKVLPYAEAAAAPPVEGELYEQRAEIVRGLTGRDRKSSRAALDRLIELIRLAAEGNKALAVSTAFSSMLAVVQELHKAGVSLGDGGFDIQGLQARLGEYDTFAGLSQGLRENLEELYEAIDYRSGNRDKLLLAHVQQYIEEHYAEDLTLETVAAVAYMNPYYFSSFFKKHMGMNFKAFVTELRMREAVRLLTTTDLMMYEIAEKVGYNNARHFSDVFKKTYGKIPNEYKQSLRKP